jgi:L-2,4-diaminobutyrate decarboxylase
MQFDESSRQLAHQLVDQLFDHVQRVESKPVVDWHSASELLEQLRLRPGRGDAASLAKLLLDHSIQLHHPSYMGHQVCPPAVPAVLADLLISTLNQSTAVFEMSPAATVIEKEIIRWLCDSVGYPATAEGTAVSGGSAANLTGLMAARARWAASPERGRPVVLCSADAHYSVARAAAIMGIGGADVLKVPTDREHRMDVAALAAALDALDAPPLAIVATSGSTATGAFDDLRPIAALRDAHSTWLHVDAAHGASVLLSDRLRPLADGLDLADSLSWDPHKMLWMPLSFGAILVRDGVWLRRAFNADAPYLFGPERAGENLGEMTIQCSKRADAVKLWFTLQLLGTEPLAAALDGVTEMTRYLYESVAASDDFEPLHEPVFNIFCFRHRSDDATNGALRERLIRSGEAWITSTVLRGRRVLRVTMINPRTERRHVDAMLASLRKEAAELRASSVSATP